MRKLLLIAALLLVAPSLRAQFTTVTATVVDPTGAVYQNCTGNASFVPSPNATQVPIIAGGPVRTPIVINSCDSFGRFTIVLADNNQVQDGHTAPPASKWNFSICAQAGTPCNAVAITITGTNQDISTALQPMPLLPATGGANPAGNNGDLQMKNGNRLAASSLNDNGTTVLVKEDMTNAGPNPYYDCRVHGCATTTFWNTYTTATISGGSQSATLGSAQDFANGNGILIIGAGPAPSISAPTGLTGSATWLTGSTTYNYCVADEDFFGGLTACSATAAATGAAATLGKNVLTITNTGCSRTTGLVTCNTTATHNLQAGYDVYIVAGSTGDSSFEGTYSLTSASGTQFQYTQYGAPDNAGAAVTGGSVQAIGQVTLKWNVPSTGTVIRHHIYRCTSSCGSLANYSYAGTSVGNDGFYLDQGLAVVLSSVGNGNIPATAPTVASNQWLSTEITTGGGTTSVTLRDAATNSVSGAQAQHDNAPNIIDTCKAFTTGTGAQPTNGGTIYIGAPTMSSNPTVPFFPIASNLDLGNCPGGNALPQIQVVVGSEIWATGTIIPRNFVTFLGTSTGRYEGGGAGFYPHPPNGAIWGTAIPIVYIRGGFGVNFKAININQRSFSAGAIALVSDTVVGGGGSSGYFFEDTSIDVGYPGGPAYLMKGGFGFFFQRGEMSVFGPGLDITNSPVWTSSILCGLGAGTQTFPGIIETDQLVIVGGRHAMLWDQCFSNSVMGNAKFTQMLYESGLGAMLAVTPGSGGSFRGQIVETQFETASQADQPTGSSPFIDLAQTSVQYLKLFGGNQQTSVETAPAGASGSGIDMQAGNLCVDSNTYSGSQIFRMTDCNGNNFKSDWEDVYYSPIPNGTFRPGRSIVAVPNSASPSAPTLAICSSSCGSPATLSGTFFYRLIPIDLDNYIYNSGPTGWAFNWGLGPPGAFSSSITLTPGTNCTSGSTCAVTLTLPALPLGAVAFAVCRSLTNTGNPGCNSPSTTAGAATYTDSGAVQGGGPTAINTAALVGESANGFTTAVSVNYLPSGGLPSAISGVIHQGNVSGTLTSDTKTSAPSYASNTNCSVNSVSPAACGAAPAGAFVVPTTTTTYTVNTSAVTSHSRIFLQPITFASDLPSSPTCVAPLLTTDYSISAVSVGTSFTLTLTSTTGQTCWYYWIIN